MKNGKPCYLCYDKQNRPVTRGWRLMTTFFFFFSFSLSFFLFLFIFLLFFFLFLSQKIEKFPRKKVVRNFLINLLHFNFLEIFTKDVLITLLRGQITIRKKHKVVFDKSTKKTSKYSSIRQY